MAKRKANGKANGMNAMNNIKRFHRMIPHVALIIPRLNI